MKRSLYRTPKGYDGTETTSRSVSDVLGAVMSKIGVAFKDRPDLILEAWPSIIGPQLAAMTQAVSCVDGVLTVKVKNSTLHSLLSRNEKHKLLAALKSRFPTGGVRNIVFRIG